MTLLDRLDLSNQYVALVRPRHSGLLEKVHKSARWQEYAVNNLYENRWMGSAEFTRYLIEQRAAQKEFVDSLGLGKK